MTKTMQRISGLARIIILDGLRRHAVIGLILLALAAEVSGLFFFQFISRDIGRAVCDFTLSVGWLAGMLFLFFHAVQAVAWDDERRVIQAILSRPLSRTEYVLGVFAGLAALLLLLNLVLGLLGWGALLLIQGMVAADYFANLSVGFFLLSWAGIFAMELMILAIILLFSSMVRGGFPVLLMTVCYYGICNGLPVAREAMASHKDVPAGQEVLLKWLTVVFPDFSRFDFKIYTATIEALPSWHLFVVDFAFMAAYVAVFLALGCLIYQQRDLQ